VLHVTFRENEKYFATLWDTVPHIETMEKV
jgi:hypothetical protein